MAPFADGTLLWMCYDNLSNKVSMVDSTGQTTYSSNETGVQTSWTYDPASRKLTAVAGSALTTYGFDPNGNEVSVSEASGATTMVYEKENRLALHQFGASTATYTYAGDGLKRTELVDGALTTLIWDGSDYYGGM